MRHPTIAVGALLAALMLGGNPGLHAATADSSVFELSGREGLLTVTVVAAPLGELLRGIGERANVRVSLLGDVTTPVTASFRSVPIDEGIKRLAQGYSVCLLYEAPVENQRAVLREAWIIASPAVRGRAVDQQRQATWLSEIQQLGIRGDAGAIPALARLVSHDSDPVIRARAVTALGRVRDPTAGSSLSAALHADPDAHVRRMAARALGTVDTEDARRALERGAVDPDPAVRQEATRALGRLVDRKR